MKKRNNPLGAKNNDSHSEKQAIVKFYTLEYRKCGNFNSKNDSRPCMGASAFLKSVDFTAFVVNVKTIAPTQKLYQSGHAIWWGDMPMAVYSFLEEYDFGAKTIIPFITHGGSGASRTVDTISELQPGALMMGNELVLSRNDVAESEETVVEWAQGLGINAVTELPQAGDGSTVLTGPMTVF